MSLLRGASRAIAIVAALAFLGVGLLACAIGPKPDDPMNAADTGTNRDPDSGAEGDPEAGLGVDAGGTPSDAMATDGGSDADSADALDDADALNDADADDVMDAEAGDAPAADAITDAPDDAG